MVFAFSFFERGKEVLKHDDVRVHAIPYEHTTEGNDILRTVNGFRLNDHDT
jgi:hypothetical protein